MSFGCFPFRQRKKNKYNDGLYDTDDATSMQIRENVVSCTSMVSQMNPLEMDDILTKLFKQLNFHSLTNARSVSQQWNRLATRSMLDRSFVSLPSQGHFCEEHSRLLKEDKEEELRKFQKNLAQISVAIKNIRVENTMAVEIFQDVRILTRHVKHLKFDFPETTSSHGHSRGTNQLCLLMDELPNLCVLETSCLDLSTQPCWDVARKSRFLNKLSVLKELRITREIDVTTLETYNNVQEKLMALKEIKLDEAATVNFIKVFVNKPSWSSQLKIDKISLKVNLNVEISLIRRFLRLLSPTLKNLHVWFMSWDDRRGHRIPQNNVADSWYIPLSLTQLTDLTINESVGTGQYLDDRRIKSATWRSILTAIQLPKLKSFTIGSHYNGRVDDLYNEFLKRGKQAKDFSCRNLETLSINCAAYFRDSSVFTSTTYTLWPNLKRLYLIVNLLEPIPTMMTSIFGQMKQLQTLRLELAHVCRHHDEDDSDEDSDDEEVPTSGLTWDRVLTGLHENCEVKKPSLRDLQGLKILCIVSRKKDLITDFLIDNELVYLKDMEHVHLVGAKISAKATKKLKDGLIGADVKVEYDLDDSEDSSDDDDDDDDDEEGSIDDSMSRLSIDYCSD